MIVSIVIPTHNRAASILRTLDALSRQQFPADAFEAIVVADGCADDTVARVRALNAPFALRCLEQNPGRGAAAARNRGAAAAAGEILLFLDDDMEARPGFLEAHVQAQRREPGSVVLGYFPMPPPSPGEDPFAGGARQWWAEGFARRASRGYRFTFRDFSTGNVSLPRSVFERFGGFWEPIDARGAGEDYEFGFRLLRAGVLFQYVCEAETVHHSIQNLEGQLGRTRQEGYGQSMIAQRHPELFRDFQVCNLSRMGHSRYLRPLWKLCWRRPGLVERTAPVLAAAYRAAARAGFHRLAERIHQQRRNLAYWAGARAAFGTLEAWERLEQDAPYEPPDTREIEIDLARDLPRLEETLVGARADAVRLFQNGEPIGRIPPWPGAEPLRPVHVQLTLLHQYGAIMLGLLAERQLQSNGAASPHHKSAPIPDGRGSETTADTEPRALASGDGRLAWQTGREASA